jgi:hypothetical protein
MEPNTATLKIKGNKGTLRLNWRWAKGEYVAHDLTAPKGASWGKVMELANRKVETYGCFVQFWRNDKGEMENGDGTYRTPLATTPMNMD